MNDSSKETIRIRTIRQNDPDYPPQFSILNHPPGTIYVAGELPRPDRPAVAIVGARLCDLYGRKMAQNFGLALAAKGVQIISGMASGVDGMAQRGALRASGKTFAVLGCGVDICYPSSNRDLYDDLLQKGGIISQFEPGTAPLNWHFPVRNELIAAFADIILVVEARRHSGSLITAHLGLDLGKDIFAVPGRVGDELSDGCNELIADGAYIASSPQKILDRLQIIRDTVPLSASGDAEAIKKRRTAREVMASDALSEEAKIVFCYLKDTDPRTADELVHASGLAVSGVSAALTELILAGYAGQDGPDRYYRAF